MQVDVVTDGRGRKLAVKRPGDREEAARLRREADLLDVATHPGLIELVELDEPEVALTTGHLEGGSLAEGRSLEVEEVAGAVAAVASTLADLHDLGLVHGAVAPEHVLFDGDGRPVLCSLGYGGLAGERRPAIPGVPAAFVDPGRAGPEDTLDPSVDVYAVGAVLSSLLAQVNGRARNGHADALRRIAERSTSGVPADRPGARRLADEIHDQVPGARLPGSSRPGAGPPAPADRPALPGRPSPLESWRHAQVRVPRPRERRGRNAAVGVVVAAAAVAGVLVLRGRPPAPTTSQAEAVTAETTAAPPTTLPPTSSVPATTSLAAPPAPVQTAPPRPGCPDVAGPLVADVDGDGCPDEVRITGGVVEAAGRRWQLGDATDTTADVVAVGDWSCSGRRSLAVLQPDTGDVFAFTGWATADHQLGAPLLAQIAGARALRAADLDGDGCNELVVERSEGAPAVLRVPRDGS